MKEMICIRCPLGCRLTVTGEGQALEVAGNNCAKGRDYAIEEATAPKRMVTCTVKAAGAAQPLSVKTAQPIPKDKIFACVQAVKALKLAAPVRIGDVVLDDVCGTGVAVVATKSV